MYTRAKEHNSAQQAGAELQGLVELGVQMPGWSRSRSWHGLLQQARHAARGFRTGDNFITIAYLRMSKLKHLPASPFAPVRIT